MIGSASVLSSTLVGVEAIPIDVQASITPGLPGITIVGMGDGAVREARTRVRSAIKFSRFTMPRGNVTVNLAPAAVKKTGAGLDLPIAISILIASGQLAQSNFDHKLVVGELSLDGRINGVNGYLAYERLADSLEKNLILIPLHQQTNVMPRVHKFCPAHLDEFGSNNLRQVRFTAKKESSNQYGLMLDFDQVKGQELAKRAMTIAAAGKHGMLLIGPPGCGKTMLAQRMPTILPNLDWDTRAETALIYSVLGLSPDTVLEGIPPFRSPHHSSSMAGILGGGRPVTPGEVSLAHGGVLFLDEFSEFPSNVLQSLRQLIEEGSVRIVRADGSYLFPASFQLLAASNPCPCGYLGDSEHACSCSESQINSYRTKIGGPLLDRIDLVIDIVRPDPKSLLQKTEAISSLTMATEVRKAREFTAARELREGKGNCENQSPSIMGSNPKTLETLVHQYLNSDERDWLEQTARSLQLSARSITRALRVARTIADLEESYKVSRNHLAEAIGYRIWDAKE